MSEKPGAPIMMWVIEWEYASVRRTTRYDASMLSTKEELIEQLTRDFNIANPLYLKVHKVEQVNQP